MTAKVQKWSFILEKFLTLTLKISIYFPPLILLGKPITFHFLTEGQTASCLHSHKLSLLISFLPMGRRVQGGSVSAFTSKYNVWVSVSNMSPLIFVIMFSPHRCRILQLCQNYIINYRTPVNIVFGTISLRTIFLTWFSTGGNFRSGWRPSIQPRLQWSINLCL